LKRAILVVLLVGLLLPASASAVIPQKGKFSGVTSQKNPDGTPVSLEIKVTHGGFRVKRFAIGWIATCDSGFTSLVQATKAVSPVSLGGKFHVGGSYKSTSGNLAGTQYSAQVTSKVKGKFVGERKAKGTFEATAVLIDSTTNAPVSTCTTGAITWTATHL
jgi:hypothetical protein